MKPHLVIFSGYNERAVIAFLRVLVRHEVDFSIIANGTNDRILHTPYRRNVVSIRKNPSLNHECILEAVTSALRRFPHARHIYAPTTEALNRFFLMHREVYENIGLTIPLVDELLYATVSDKRTFTDMCKAHLLDVPKEYESAFSASPPFVAKPKHYTLKKVLAPQLVRTAQDQQRFLDHECVEDFFIQEFVTGESVYLLVHQEKNGATHLFSQVNYIQQPQGKSIIAAKASEFHLTPVAKQYIEMLKAVEFYGLIMIELRKQGERYAMIEANPRFWGPSQLFVDAMPLNLFDTFLLEYGADGCAPSKPKACRYYWHEGFLATVQKGQQPDFHGYTYEQYVKEMPLWLSSDLYRRRDTLDLFATTIFGGKE